MTLNAPVGKDFKRELPPAGMMRSRCVVVYDLGTHLDPKFPKNDKGDENWRHLVQIQFELDQMMTFEGEQKPMMATKRYTLSANKKAILRQDLECWYGKKFSDEDLKKAGGINVEKLLGRPALLNIQHSDDGQYANIVSINPPMKVPGVEGDGAPPQFYPSRFFSLAEPNADVWAQMSGKTRQFIAECREVKSGQAKLPVLAQAAKAETHAASSDESTPF
jgi:hypothetical protein